MTTEFNLGAELKKIQDKQLEQLAGGLDLLMLEKAIDDFIVASPEFEGDCELAKKIGEQLGILRFTLLHTAKKTSDIAFVAV